MNRKPKVLLVALSLVFLVTGVAAYAGPSASGSCDKTVLKKKLRVLESQLKEERDRHEVLEEEKSHDLLEIKGHEAHLAVVSHELMNIEGPTASKDDPRREGIPDLKDDLAQTQSDLEDLRASVADIDRELERLPALESQKRAFEAELAGGKKACMRAKQPDDLDLFVAGLQDGLSSGKKLGARSHNDPSVAGASLKHLDERGRSAYERGFRKGVQESGSAR